jgi:amino acid transporter
MTGSLKRALGPWQFFSFAFGSIVGVGWVVFLGDWLNRGGPVGAILGFGVGAALMALIGLCYAEALTMFPVSGGEVPFAFEAFGVGPAYAVGWALIMTYIGAVAYVASSMAWILDYLVPGIQGPALYAFRGTDIHLGSLLIALLTVAWLTWLNSRGVRSSGRFQDVLTYSKILVAVVFMAAGIFGGSVGNLEPLFSTANQRTAVGGVLAVMAVVPWFLGGFNTIPQVMEEKAERTSLRLVGRITVLSIGAGALFYCLVILSASMALPWRELVARELPAATAFRQAFGSELLARVVLLTGLLGIATVGNGTFVAATRLLFALSRASLLAPGFGRTHPVTGAPDRAILFTGLVAALGTLLGRQGIGPIVAVGAVGLSFGYFLTSAAVLRLRFTAPDQPRPYRVRMGVPVAAAATVGSLGLMAAALRDHWTGAGGRFPFEWMLLGAWAGIGLVLWLNHWRAGGLAGRRAEKLTDGQTD